MKVNVSPLRTFWFFFSKITEWGTINLPEIFCCLFRFSVFVSSSSCYTLLYTLYWLPCDAREVAVSGCCFVPARWRPRDGSVRGLFRACEVTDPEVAQCVGAVLCPRDDRLWDQLSVPGATSDTMSTNRESSIYIVTVFTRHNIDWTDTITSDKWSSVVRSCVYIWWVLFFVYRWVGVLMLNNIIVKNKLK